MKNLKQLVIGVLVALFALGGLTACSQAEADSSVSCEDVTFNVTKTQTEIAKAEEKVDSSTGTPGEKQAKKELSELQKRLTALKACDNNTADPTASDDCKDQFVQNHKFDEKLNRFVRGGIDSSSAEKSNAKMMKAVGHSAEYLHLIAADTFGLSDVPEASDMVTDSCLNKAGQTVYNRLKDITSASGMKFKNAPKDAFNSGAHNGKAVVSKTAGIRGNRKAIEYTLPDGSKVYILVRCGNPVFSSPPPDVPHGPTDNPPPPENPPEEPPGNPGKNPALDPAAQGNVPEQVKGRAPAPREDHRQPTRPADPPPKYTPPPAPKPKPPAGSTPTTQPSNPPATGSNNGNDGGSIDQPDW